MKRFISLLFVLVVMLLLTTSIVGAESRDLINSNPNCGSELPGNGKGKAKGHTKNCTNENDAANETNETEFNSADQGFDRTPSTGSTSTGSTSTVPNWFSLNEDGLPNQDSSFLAETSTVSVAPDCSLDDGGGVIRGVGAVQGCKSRATTFTEIEIEVFYVDAWVACAGDWVRVSGRFRFLTHTTIDANGRYHTKIQFAPMGVSGFGSPSGTYYRGTGVTQWQNKGIVGTPQTYINNFRLISTGSAPNLMIHQNVHTTVNANGDVTSNIDHTTISCR